LHEVIAHNVFLAKWGLGPAIIPASKTLPRWLANSGNGINHVPGCSYDQTYPIANVLIYRPSRAG
jgi:hypothetical protein